MNKERLEIIEHKVERFALLTKPPKPKVIIDDDDYEYLKEQAERGHELEEEYKVRRDEYLEEHIDRLEQQNKRYRERFEAIQAWVLKSDVDLDLRLHRIHVISDEALEGESHE